MAKLTVLDPTDGPFRTATVLARRLDSIEGATLGIIWNGRPHGDKILQRVAKELSDRWGCSTAEFLQKPFMGNVAPGEFFQTLLTRRVNFVITGLGD